MGSKAFISPIKNITLGSCWLVLAAAAAAALSNSCLNRPVTPSEPETSNRFVDQIRYTTVDKIDLLFVVDNSVSMADKQQILKRAVPSMLKRLVDPPCVDASFASEPAMAAEPACRAGFQREFEPIADIHIGVITSSLGSRGSGGCAPENGNPDDRGLLLPSVRPGLSSWNSSGFLLWDPKAKYAPAGTADLEQLSADFSAMIESVHDDGCGYESSLEAWYRFLIDPEPALAVRIDPTTGQSVPDGVDQDVLAQRAAFLRPDSLLGIVMLTDEDDCSISDRGFGWLLGDGSHARPRPTSACASDPDSICCRPCTSVESTPPSGCTPIADDPSCSMPQYALHDSADHANQRCFDQKRRYGMEFLHPISRYTDGLKQPLIPNRAGELVPNPLFSTAPGKLARLPSLVFLGGILGVPWADVASDASLSSDTLDYLNNQELIANGRWDMILGQPHAQDPAERVPRDALMIPALEPRSGVHPLLGLPLAPATSLNPQENPLNGHEYLNLDNSDLQYACTFPLELPFECTDEMSCDCHLEEDVPRNRPLCQPPSGGPASTTQYYAKAYPGRRLLEVLNAAGDQGVVASICPKVALGDSANPSYGYNPALAAVIDIFKTQLGRCLPRPLQVADDGGVPCRVAEATRGACDCAALSARVPVTSELDEAVRSELLARGQCAGDSGIACSDYCVCEIEQSRGDDLVACQNDEASSSQNPGYCYIDAERIDSSGQPAPIGNPELLGGCQPGQRRNLRFVGENTPQNGAVTFIACTGAPVGGVD